MRRGGSWWAVVAVVACACALRPGPLTPTLSPAGAGERESVGAALPAAPLPPPKLPDLPPLAPPPAADLSDPIELLWGHRLEFAGAGEPLVTIRLMEGQREIAFRPLGPARVLLRNGTVVDVPAGTRLSVRARDAVPAVIAWRALLADVPLSERPRLAALREAHERSGLRVESRLVGGVYGIAGRVVDNRRELLVAATDGTLAGARAAASPLRAKVFGELVARPTGTLSLLAPGGAPLGEADAALGLVVEGDAGFVVEDVLHDHGHAVTAREHRSYKGRLYVTIDAAGALAAVHGVPLEQLLRGLVPSEMPSGVHAEALKAQAVTARSNVLAQIGTRHLTDPFMLCAEVHCQAYRGDGARTPRTDAAVEATRGEALFGRADRTLVDAVYSAMCGGHGEDNDAVWDHAPSPSLRGGPDLPPADAARWTGGLADEARLRAFLDAPGDAWCRRSAAAPRRFRWERRLSPAALDEAGREAGVGHLTDLRVTERGVSGRARTLLLEGEEGRAEVHGELRIRRLLGDLPSAMFLAGPDGAGGLALRGGGWGHGAGMCQWGAVGRAEAGQGYREILRAYYAGAEVARVY